MCARQTAWCTRRIFATSILFAAASVTKHFTFFSTAHSLKSSQAVRDALRCVTDRVSSQKGGGEFSCLNSIKCDSEIRIHVDGSPHICGQADTGNILQGCLGLLLFFQIPPLHHGFNSLPWWKGDVRSSLATRAQKPWSDTTVKGWQSFTLNSTRVSSSSCFLLPKI